MMPCILPDTDSMLAAGAMTRAVIASKPFNLTQPKAKVQHIEQPLPPRTR